MITKQMLKEIRSDLEKVLEEIGEKHGVIIKAGNASFTPVEATMKIEITSVDKDSDEYRKSEWDKHCKIYGFNPEDYGLECIDKGERYRLVGFNPGSPKNRIKIIRIRDGAEYRCSIQMCKLMFELDIQNL